MINPDLGEPHLPGILEAAGIAGAGDAIFVIGVDGTKERARGIGGDDRAALIGEQILRRGSGSANLPLISSDLSKIPVLYSD